MSNVQELKQDRSDCVGAVDEVDISIYMFVELVASFGVVAIPCGLLMGYFSYIGFSPYDSPTALMRALMELLIAMVSIALFVYLIYVVGNFSGWLKYKRLMKEGVLTTGTLTQNVELPDSENYTPTPYIIYSFAEGHPTLQKVDSCYKVETQIIVRYVPGTSLSRAELSKW